MIRIELDDAALSRIRIAISPLWETVCSMLLLERRGPELEFPYTRWGRTAQAAITGPAAFAYEVANHNSYWPDFLCPAPSSPAPSIEDELATIRATPPEVMEREFAAIGNPDYHRFISPGEIDRYVDGIEAYWYRAIRPFWPEMRAALEQEVLFRAKSLATFGASGLLADLHPRVRWEPPILTLVKDEDYEFSAASRPLLLIPLIFSRGALMCGTEELHSIAVSYQARGAIVLADRDARPDALAAPDLSTAPDGLAMLLGRGRAQVLRGLGTPSTTAGLAAMLGLAQSTVSEHLTVLVNAGVAHRHRSGRQVVYGLEPAGRAMVTLIAPDSV